MKAMTKTIICLLLVLTMALGMLPALAATSPAGTVLYFENTAGWSTAKIYYWSDSNTSMTTWPGESMTKVEGNIYSFTVPAEATYVIFNNGSGTQTGNLPIPDSDDLYNYGTGAWSVYEGACDHSWDEGTVTKAATCTENGSVTYKCTLCGESQVGAVNATGHKFSGNTCTVCGETLLVIYYENTTGWSNVNIYFWSDSDTNMAPWPGNAMEKLEGDIYSLAINSDAQYVIFNNGSEQTGDLTIPEGMNYYNGEWSYYSTCDHAYDNGVVTKEVTCTTDGEKTYTCSLCNETKTEVIEAPGHSFVGGVCSVCGATEPCTDHSWDDGAVTTEATCTSSGVKTYTCTKCKSTKTETILSLGHNMVDGVCTRCGEIDNCSHFWRGGSTISATCEKDGSYTETCLFCGGKKVTVIPAKGHQYVAGRCYVCGKEQENVQFVDISNAAELLAFADRVNAGENTLNGRLTADIDLNGANWTAIGYYLKNGTDSLPYKGLFDGNGHTVSNFTVAGNDSVGLFGYAEMAIIKNLGVINVTATGANAGAIIGNAATSTIIDCYAKDCTITGYTTNPVALSSRRVYVGAIAGQGSGYVYNCYAINCQIIDKTGDMTIPAGETYRPWHEFYSSPLGGNGSSISNNYYYNVTGTFSSTSGATEVTMAQLTSGEVTYLLNKGVTDGTQAWYQTCGTGLPAHSGKTVYQVENADGSVTYTNEEPACDHNYVDGTCTICGEADPNYVPVVVPIITLKTPTLLLEDTIKLNIYYTIDQDIALENMGMLTWSSKPDVVDISTAENIYPGATYNAGNGYYGVNTDGIPAQNLGDIIYFCVYAELADGTIAYGKQVQYSPSTYAYNQINGGASAEMKALLVAILNYGAAAQTYLEDTDALVNANLTDAAKALVEEYNADMVHSVAGVPAAKQGALASNGGFSAKKPSISLGGAFSINYYFTPSATVAGDMTLYYWNAAVFAAADVLSIENATGSSVMANEDGVYGGAVAGIAAKDVDSALYACGVYTDANGNTYSTGILPYSLGFYCGNQVKAGGETADLAAAIAVYGYYAAAYFAA